MISAGEIESAYKHLIKIEEDLFEATEEEINARIYFDSLNSIDPKFRGPDFFDEKMARLKELEAAEKNKRCVMHLHRMAKWGIQRNKDLLECWRLEHMPDEYGEAEIYDIATVAANNARSRKMRA